MPSLKCESISIDLVTQLSWYDKAFDSLLPSQLTYYSALINLGWNLQGDEITYFIYFTTVIMENNCVQQHLIFKVFFLTYRTFLKQSLLNEQMSIVLNSSLLIMYILYMPERKTTTIQTMASNFTATCYQCIVK